MKTNTIILIVVLLLIVGSIVYLENVKPAAVIGSLPDAADTASAEVIAAKEAKYPRAPELIVGGEWMNAEPLTMASLRGKVVLLDIWTYSCINCIRTLPYITNWWDKYEDAGLVIVGVHAPEFDFEKDPDNVRKAIEKYSIEYPVMQDNDRATWSAYRNNYWPRKYLIDIDGFVRYDHIGEGGYEDTELQIQELLAERMQRSGESMDVNKPISVPEGAVSAGPVGTPELYFGSAFRRNVGGNAEGYPPGETVTYAVPAEREPNTHYVSGTWSIHPDYMELESDGSVYLTYYAKNVNIVASSETAQEITVLLDGQPITDSDVSDEVVEGGLLVKDERLYSVVFSPESATHSLEFQAKKGFRIYTFTFG